VPTSVSIPPINPAILSGIISRPGASFCRSATSSTDGNENRDDAGRTHDRPQHRDGEHQQDKQPPLAARRAAQQEIADLHREPRAHESIADDEKRRDEHDIRIAESGERLRAP
jgi:hypothetical protein